MSEDKHINKKEEQLKPFIRDTYNQEMISNEGKKIADDENSLTAGDRGPTLIEDFLAREKLLLAISTDTSNQSVQEKSVVTYLKKSR